MPVLEPTAQQRLLKSRPDFLKTVREKEPPGAVSYVLKKERWIINAADNSGVRDYIRVDRRTGEQTLYSYYPPGVNALKSPERKLIAGRVVLTPRRPYSSQKIPEVSIAGGALLLLPIALAAVLWRHQGRYRKQNAALRASGAALTGSLIRRVPRAGVPGNRGERGRPSPSPNPISTRSNR